MSRQFKTDRVWNLNAPTPDFDVKQVFADAGSEVYRYNGPAMFGDLDMSDDHLDPDAWSDCGTMFRDYWVFHCDRNDDNGPYFQRALDADRTIIKEFDA